MSNIWQKQMLTGIPLAFIIFFFLVIFPLNEKNIRLLKEIYRIKNVSQSPDTLVAWIERMQQQNRKLQGKIFSLENELPMAGNMSGIYALLGELAVKNHIRISRIIPGEILPDTSVLHLPVELEIEAGFSETLIYLYALENECFSFRIRECLIENSGEGTVLLSHISLDIFLKKEDDE